MKTYSFTIRTLRTTEKMELEQARVLIGSGAHCDIRLAPESAAFEHMVVTVEDEDQVVVRVIPLDATAQIDGQPFREAVITDGQTLVLEGVTLEFSDRVTSSGAQTKKKKSGGTSPLAYIGMVVILVGFGWIMMKKVDGSFEPPEAVPEPLSQPVQACPAKTQQQAMALGWEKEQLAQAKRQRWKFYPRDGVEAVPLYELAESCYKAAGDMQRAADAGLYAKAMRAGVGQEFQVYRVRLERALSRHDSKVALTQIHFLRDMLFTRDMDDEYVRWLTIMQRKLEAEASRES